MAVSDSTEGRGALCFCSENTRTLDRVWRSISIARTT